VFIEGISTKTSKDSLKSYLEQISGLKVKDITYGTKSSELQNDPCREHKRGCRAGPYAGFFHQGGGSKAKKVPNTQRIINNVKLKSPPPLSLCMALVWSVGAPWCLVDGPSGRQGCQGVA
jgi:hypothetical protein